MLTFSVATGDVAIPSGNLARSEAGTTTTTEASSTTEANSAATPTDMIYQIGSEACSNTGRTTENWNKFGIDNYTGEMYVLCRPFPE